MRGSWCVVRWILALQFRPIEHERAPKSATQLTGNRCVAYCDVLKYVYTKKVDMYKNDGVTRRYSESFKLKILAELSTGKYSKRQLSRIYGIQSSTINEWVRKYDRKDLMNTRIMVQTKDEISRLKALQKEVEQLKELLIKKDLDRLVLDSYLEVAAKT